MNGRNSSQRGASTWIAAVAISVLFTSLAACGGNDDSSSTESQSEPAKQSTQTQVIAPSDTAQPKAIVNTPSDSAANTEPAPRQVSETDDGSETIDEPAPSKSATPTLRLASAAKPEPKPAPSQFKEGVNYQRLVPTQPTGVSPGQVEIVEVFWYGCPHCFALDPKLEAWRQKAKPSYVVFSRIPATWNDATLFHARVFYTADLLGKLEQLHTPIFREIHLNGNLLNTMDKTKAFFTAQGIDKSEFDKTFASFTLEQKIRTATEMNRRYKVQSVPFFIVNGKYTLDVASAGSEEQLLQLLNELAAREHVN
jgi:thiol:disulfide interchange protein DsbA